MALVLLLLPLTSAFAAGSSYDADPFARVSYSGLSATTIEDAEANATRGAGSLLGRSYGKVGTVVESPGLRITGLPGASDPYHAINQIITREVSAPSLLNTVRNPSVVLKQSGGNYLHLSPEAGVVLRADGQVVTAYSSAQFNPHIIQILQDAGAVP